MNRTTVVFLALAILVAHTFAIHQTSEGGFAAPYDRAHVAYRLGRHLVHEGRAVWDAPGGSSAVYPSPSWIGVSATAELLRLPPTRFAQSLGILLALATVFVLAQFSPERLAGLIAPVLFAASGSVAAAAASGTEAPLAMALAASAYLAFERGWPRLLALVLVLLALTRPEGVVLAVGVTALQWLDPPRDVAAERVARMRRWTLGAWAVLATLFLLRGARGSPFARTLASPDPERWASGLAYLEGFFVASAVAPLLLLPVALAALRRLGGAGRRPLALFLLWALVVGLAGGDELPFWNALAPALPLALLAVQTAITGWLDGSPRHAPAAWTILAVTVATSLLVSMTPANLGPLRLRAPIERWMTPGERLARDFPRPLGRAGLAAELRETEALRSVGIFLRDKVEPDARIGTFWPGAIGYLCRRRVFDLVGRTQPLPGSRVRGEDVPPARSIDVWTAPNAWSGRPRVDVVETLTLLELDYVVPGPGVEPKPIVERLRGWLRDFDVVGDTPERLDALLEALADFELVAVPVPISSHLPDTPSAVPFQLLRRRALGAGTSVALERDGASFAVDVHHEGHRQIVDLSVSFTDRAGNEWALMPTGEWTFDVPRAARTGMLLHATGSRAIRFLEAELPGGGGTLSARLHSPGIAGGSPLVGATSPAVLDVDG